MDLETEIMLQNNLPSIFQTINRNIQNDPAGVFQEIIQNASQPSRNNAQPTYSKAINQQFSQQLQPQTCNNQNLPIIHYPNSIPAKMMELNRKPSSSKKIILIESIKFEPYQVLPEQQQQPAPMSPVPSQMFFCKEEPVQPQLIPYCPPVKYEPVNVMPQFYYSYPPEFDRNGNQVCHANDNGYFKNLQYAMSDHQNQKQMKKKSLQDKRKGLKKGRVKKGRMADESFSGEGIKRPCSRTSIGSDENPIQKRSMHNSMERQRRIGLKNLFVELKDAIPTLNDRERVPKVSILREAIAYCEKLHNDEKMFEDLKKKHNKLMTHFHKLYKTMNA